MHIHAYVHIYIYTCIYIHICTSVHIHTYTYIHTHIQHVNVHKHKHVWIDCALSRHRAAQTTSDHLYWCETNPPDPWPSGLIVSPHLKPLQRCSAPKNDVYSSASTGGIYPPASSPLSPAGIVPETRFVQPRYSPDKIHHPPSAGSLRRALTPKECNICGFQQPSRAPPAVTNSMAHPISAASSNRRAPFRPRASPARATGHAPK